MRMSGEIGRRKGERKVKTKVLKGDGTTSEECERRLIGGGEKEVDRKVRNWKKEGKEELEINKID